MTFLRRDCGAVGDWARRVVEDLLADFTQGQDRHLLGRSPLHPIEVLLMELDVQRGSVLALIAVLSREFLLLRCTCFHSTRAVECHLELGHVRLRGLSAPASVVREVALGLHVLHVVHVDWVAVGLRRVVVRWGERVLALVIQRMLLLRLGVVALVSRNHVTAVVAEATIVDNGCEPHLACNGRTVRHLVRRREAALLLKWHMIYVRGALGYEGRRIVRNPIGWVLAVRLRNDAATDVTHTFN